MSTTKRNQMSEIMRMAWQLVKRNGYGMADALRCAWRNIKLRIAMSRGIVKFYYQKVDGSLREAYGTLAADRIPAISGNDTRKKNDSVQTYYDTEREEWRCFKVANLVEIA